MIFLLARTVLDLVKVIKIKTFEDHMIFKGFECNFKNIYQVPVVPVLDSNPLPPPNCSGGL
jgi:hypothetical protein